MRRCGCPVPVLGLRVVVLAVRLGHLGMRVALTGVERSQALGQRECDPGHYPFAPRSAPRRRTSAANHRAKDGPVASRAVTTWAGATWSGWVGCISVTASGASWACV